MNDRPNSRPSFFKRTYLILPQLQIRFIVAILLCATSLLAVFYILELILLEEILEIPAEVCDTNKYLCERAMDLKSKVDQLFLYKVFFVLITFGFFGVYLTHKVAGPVYRLKNALRSFGAGKKTEPVVLRKGDFLHDLADEINQIIAKK
jgi:hypothetical protein